MRIRLTIVALVGFLLVFRPVPGDCRDKRLGMEKVKSDPAIENVVKGGLFETSGKYTGWRSNIPRVPAAERSGEKNAYVIMDLAQDNVFSPKWGTLEFWVYNDGRVKGSHADVLGTFVDNVDGRALLTVSLYWLGRGSSEKVALEFDGAGYNTAGWPVYGKLAFFDQQVAPGQWAHVAVTWGPGGEKENIAYLNGKPAVAYNIPSEAAAAPRTGNLADFIKDAKAFMIGSEPHGNDLFRNGLIEEVTLHDTVLTTFSLLKHKTVIANLRDNAFNLPGISGKLVAGETIEVSFEAEPGGAASFDLASGKSVPMTASADNPAVYRGQYVVQPGEYVENARITARFTGSSGIAADPVTSETPISIDARSRFALTIDKTDLPADSAATARVKVKVTDANGNPIKDHRIKVTLSTTDEYTGVVGGGSARSKDIAAANEAQLGGAEVETRWDGVTDSWGEVEFDFKAGFAAKTIILQAKDLTAGNVGVDYITSYKEASIDIALTPPRSLAAARRGLQYIIKVEATRTELTADGRSRSVIRATVMDPNGKPVAGDPVAFTLSSLNGTIRTINGTTDAAGVATGEYVAGKKIGIVVVTATDTARNISANVSIILLADAPAKIYLKARPESLPADGFSRADLSVKVTDINDNPNKDTKVEFKVAKGGGRVEYADRTTDRFGDSANRYTAGTTPGIATVLATVRSKVPTEAELAKAQNVLFVPYSEQGEEIRVSRWLKRVGETALKGEPIVEYTIGRDETKYTLKAPYDCRLDFQYVEYWDNARTGDTLAQISPVTVPGSAGSAPAPAPSRSLRRR